MRLTVCWMSSENIALKEMSSLKNIRYKLCTTTSTSKLHTSQNIWEGSDLFSKNVKMTDLMTTRKSFVGCTQILWAIYFSNCFCFCTVICCFENFITFSSQIILEYSFYSKEVWQVLILDLFSNPNKIFPILLPLMFFWKMRKGRKKINICLTLMSSCLNHFGPWKMCV